MLHILVFNRGTKKEVNKMNQLKGRPKIDKPKTIEVKARIDEETNLKLEKYCKENSLNRADIIRKGIDLVLKEK